ncbi:hypothetical protein BJX70DRAFT_395215 [Aspergillus crustosus]
MVSLSNSTPQGSDYEQAYASPAVFRQNGYASPQPELPNTYRGTLGRDGRKRRYQGSSNDDDGAICDDGFINEDLRVGGPYLCPLPATVREFPIQHPIFDPLSGFTLMNKAAEIMMAHNLSYSIIQLYEKRSNLWPEISVISICICSRRTRIDGTWLSAARAILAFIDREDIGPIAVEIADPCAFETCMDTLVYMSDPVFDIWDKVQDRILETIDVTDVTKIVCRRSAFAEDPVNNPPTVLMTVDYRKMLDWRETRDTVVRILDEFGLGMMAVCITKGRVSQEAELAGQN